MQFLVRSGNDPDVDTNQLSATNHAKGSVFQNAQQIALAFRGQITDFIEEQRTTVSQLKAARFVGNGAGERTFDMAE